ncbi:MAG: hypothetical protein Q4P20_06480 [Eubacteriales bacterium]|nr:hypothetical protein [Eubacteriales bacterium]
MKKSKLILPAAAALLTLGVTLHTSLAYFTTYTTARGTRPITLETQQTKPTVTETFGDWTKHVVIDAEEGSAPIFIRAKAFSSDNLTYNGNGKWTLNEADGFYYYSDPIADDGSAYDKSTAALDIRIDRLTGRDPQIGEQFDVIVVYEYTTALTGADGKLYADWTQVYSVGGDS